MTEFIAGVPIPLLFLVHLHLLEYPLANNPEYDHNLFDPNVRGLRDRTKSMEDVCYFLVGKVGHRKETAKAILPMYPCLAPADTTAFRTALTKHLETLRQNAIHPKTGSGFVITSSRANNNKEATVGAWWWKDVVVRKSLLEECAGVRFERLLLSLSTHALFTCTSGQKHVPIDVALGSTPDIFRVQSQAYTTLLASSQSTQYSWERSASLLQQRLDDLTLLRNYLAPHFALAPSKYEALTTDKLLSSMDAKLLGLSHDFWPGTEGHQALDVLIELAGLNADYSIPISQSNDGSDACSINRDSEVPILPVQPLPIAAAHHPSSLHKLRTSIKAQSVDNAGPVAKQPPSHADISLSVQVRAEQEMASALHDALARTGRMGLELRAQLHHEREIHRTNMVENQRITNLNSWRDDESQPHNMNPTPELLSSVTAYKNPSSSARDACVSHIRGPLLPAYPPIQDPAPKPLQSCLPGRSKRTSGISQAPAQSDLSQGDLSGPSAMDGTVDEDQALTTPRRLITSTPPASVKPRSAYVRRVLASQSKEQSRRKGKVEFVVSGSTGLRKSRKSFRMSTSLTKRPSLFGPPMSHDEDIASIANGHDVDQIIGAVRDESTSFENSFMTPKITRLPSPYKFKSVSPSKKAATHSGPRPSFKIVERLSLAPLPDSLMSADDLFHETRLLCASDADGSWTDEDEVPGSDRGANVQGDDEGYEGKSITLRDILLQAGTTTQFDLLKGDGFNLDGSFTWE